jgi:hypothetical protein
MKYICLGYIEPGKLPEMTEEQQQAMLDECFEYDENLRAKGYLAAGEGLQPPETASTLYWKNGKSRPPTVPTQLISQHPGVKYGPWEIRRAADLSDMVKQSEQRRRKRTAD